ncbi:GTPase HflX [Pseudoxanthobacter sp. M-2]|uniref:GTPase HflX n=1 Tax=Pseudoxanthobacter sp. M-2 TaxID=3078754 RepID=UPI0038FC4F45
MHERKPVCELSDRTPDEEEAGPDRRDRREGISRLAKRTRAIVIAPVRTERRSADAGEGAATRSPEARLAEAVGLAGAIDLEVVGAYVVRLSATRPATLFGTGKVEELKLAVATEEADLVVVDHPLTPVQQRNLEKAWSAKVLDRTALILEIFGARARTREGTLQVELAHLNWQKSRLVRTWTHLERQRGGFGFLGGPGETQIEADRRLIQERIIKIERELEDVKRTRGLHRANRKKVPHPVIALVGYTNAGKSTLFNRLTDAGVLSKDLLFATLDPTLRQIRLPHGGSAILSDTVGFISDLPTHLVAAFRATLEEVVEADVILHVRDVSHPDSDAQSRDVQETLTLLDIDPHDRDRLIEVLNKIDLVDAERRARLLASPEGEGPVAISAVTGEGVNRLLARIEARLSEDKWEVRLVVPVTEGELLAWLHRSTEVMEREDGEDGVRLVLRVPPRQKVPFKQRAGRYIHPSTRGSRRAGAA